MRRRYHPRQDPRACYYYGEWDSNTKYVSDKQTIAVVRYKDDYYVMKEWSLDTIHGLTTKSPDKSELWVNSNGVIPSIKTKWLESGPIYISEIERNLLN